MDLPFWKEIQVRKEIGFYPMVCRVVIPAGCGIGLLILQLKGDFRYRSEIVVGIVLVAIAILVALKRNPLARRKIEIENEVLVLTNEDGITRVRADEVEGYEISRTFSFKLVLHLKIGSTVDFPLDEIFSEVQLKALLQEIGIRPLRTKVVMAGRPAAVETKP